MPDYSYIALIPLLPLAAFVLLGLAGKNRLVKTGGLIGSVSLLASTVISLYAAYQYFL